MEVLILRSYINTIINNLNSFNYEAYIQSCCCSNRMRNGNKLCNSFKSCYSYN